jgi:hypothetical protein
VSVSNALPADITTGLVAAYLLNEGTGNFATDSSGNGNTGTLVNNPIWSSGIAAGGLSFQRVNDYINIPSTTGLNISGDLTVALWVNHRSQTGDGDFILSKGVCYNGSCPYELRLTGKGYLCFDQNNGLAGQEAFCSAQAIPLNTWKHVAVVRSGNEIRIYIDGVLSSGPFAFTRTPTANAQPLSIGSNAYSFDGVMDNVRIYSRALTAADIAALYSGSN